MTLNGILTKDDYLLELKYDEDQEETARWIYEIISNDLNKKNITDIVDYLKRENLSENMKDFISEMITGINKK